MKQDSITPGISAKTIVTAKVTNRAALIGIRLIHFSGTVKPNPAMGKPSDIRLDCNTRVEIDEKNRRIAVLAKLHVTVNQHQDEQIQTESSQVNSPVSPDAEIVVEHAIIYQIDSFEGLTEQDYGIFANTSGIFHVWPYWREFAQNMSIRMGIPPIILPLFRVLPVPPATINPPKKTKPKSKHPS